MLKEEINNYKKILDKNQKIVVDLENQEKNLKTNISKFEKNEYKIENENIENENIENENSSELLSDENKLSDEIEKLNQLLKDVVLTQEEFEKAKKKLLDN